MQNLLIVNSLFPFLFLLSVKFSFLNNIRLCRGDIKMQLVQHTCCMGLSMLWKSAPYFSASIHFEILVLTAMSMLRIKHFLTRDKRLLLFFYADSFIDGALSLQTIILFIDLLGFSNSSLFFFLRG